MESITNKLNELLSDLNVFYRKLQNYHWNITGRHFFVLHEKLEEYYDEINEQIDEVAEHILTLDMQPLGTMKDYLEKAKIEEASNTKIEDTIVIEKIMKDYETLLQKVICIKKDADEHHLFSTSSLMDGYILKYSKIIWMLKQLKK